MDRMQRPSASARALPDRHAWGRGAHARTAGLCARLLAGDAEAAQVTRGTFHLLHWEHRGQQIFPLRDDQKNPRPGDR